MKDNHSMLRFLSKLAHLTLWIPATIAQFLLYKAQKWHQQRNGIDHGRLKLLEHRRVR